MARMTSRANDFKKIGTFNGVEITEENLIEPPAGLENFANDIAELTTHKRRTDKKIIVPRKPTIELTTAQKKERSRRSRESYLRGVERDAKKIMRAIESGEVKL